MSGDFKLKMSLKNPSQKIRISNSNKVTVYQNNVCIDKGVFDQTYIGKNVKIDNLVHIAHDVKIYENTLIIACSFIGGRTRISKNSLIGPNCTIKNGLLLGENSRVTMGAVVVMNVRNNEIVSGNFAIPHDQFMKKI